MGLASLAASAGVGAVIALLVDLLMRPAVEARKERIVELYRERRAFVARIAAIDSGLGILRGRVSSSSLPAKLQSLRDIHSRVCMVTNEIYQNRAWMPNEVYSAVANDAAYLEGWVSALLDISESEEFWLDKERAEAMFSSLPLRTKVEGQLSLAVNYLQMPRWRILRRRDIRKRLRMLAPKNKSSGSGRTDYYENLLRVRRMLASSHRAAKGVERQEPVDSQPPVEKRGVQQ